MEVMATSVMTVDELYITKDDFPVSYRLICMLEMFCVSMCMNPRQRERARFCRDYNSSCRAALVGMRDRDLALFQNKADRNLTLQDRVQTQ